MLFLLAEDDINLRRGLSRLLQLEGYEVVATDNGSEVSALFQQHQPDFCILDVMMPGLDGFEVCRQLRRSDAGVPIILLTACSDETDRVTGLELGADDYVTKPFSARELLARIKTILRRSEQCDSSMQAAPFALGDLRISPATLRAQRRDQSIELTPRELAILQLLHRRCGRAVSRNELLDHAWGRDHMPNSRALDQYIFSLRQKIEIDPTAPLIIRTVHGVGYRYEDQGGG